MAYGRIVPSFDRGSVLLTWDQRQLRLVWNGKPEAIDVPAGPWRLRNYRIEQKQDGVEWFLSGSGWPGPRIEVTENAETRLEIADTVQLKVRSVQQAGKVTVHFSVSGHHGMGLSVVKDEARPAPAWRVMAGDVELAKGVCRYG